MPRNLALLLRHTIETELPNLKTVSDNEAAERPGGPQKWSRKEELGHLIDSASNNHIRFVLATIDGEFRGLGYAQDKWVKAHGYHNLEWKTLIDLWHQYNSLIAHLVESIPEKDMGNRCVIGWGVVTLGFLIEDYVLHMQHHLDHVLSRERITPYPSPPAPS
jgi:hypothetical protein